MDEDLRIEIAPRDRRYFATQFLVGSGAWLIVETDVRGSAEAFRTDGCVRLSRHALFRKVSSWQLNEFRLPTWMLLAVV